MPSCAPYAACRLSSGRRRLSASRWGVYARIPILRAGLRPARLSLPRQAFPLRRPIRRQPRVSAVPGSARGGLMRDDNSPLLQFAQAGQRNGVCAPVWDRCGARLVCGRGGGHGVLLSPAVHPHERGTRARYPGQTRPWSVEIHIHAETTSCANPKTERSCAHKAP